tara:strand:- start:326 stop:709 length:384 start_codon:yes stop_codon:yes gene_type:complete
MSTVKLPLGLSDNGIVNTPSEVTVNATGSGVTLITDRYKYSTALIQNVGSEDMYIRIDGKAPTGDTVVPATSTVYHTILTPMSQADLGEVSYANVTACAPSGKTTKAVLFTVQINDSVSQGATSYGS